MVNVDGVLFVKNSGLFLFGLEKFSESYNFSDDMCFWGGLVGFKIVGIGRSVEIVYGVDFIVKGDVILDVSCGVYILGSCVVIGGNGVVKGNVGVLVIDSI